MTHNKDPSCIWRHNEGLVHETTRRQVQSPAEWHRVLDVQLLPVNLESYTATVLRAAPMVGNRTPACVQQKYQHQAYNRTGC